MKTLWKIPVLLLLLFASSCEENFDVNAPYKDITIVFGLLDPGEDTVFLKINKAFLGDGNVMEIPAFMSTVCRQPSRNGKMVHLSNLTRLILSLLRTRRKEHSTILTR
jgi:hypothetical protein